MDRAAITAIRYATSCRSTRQLSSAQMTQILTAGGLTEAEAAAKLQILGLATAEGTATAATVTLSGAVTGLGTAIRAAFAANPVGMIMLAVGAAYELVKGVTAIYDALTVTAEEAREAADELHSTFEEMARELESLNSELETSKDRLAELLELSKAGTITIVEQEELDNLRDEIALLEQRQRFLDDQAEREAKAANKALENAFNTESFHSDLYAYKWAGLSKELEELRKNQAAWAEEDKARYDELMAIFARNTAANGNYGSWQAGQELGYDEYIQLLIDRYHELDDIGEKTMADLYEMDAIETKLSELGGSLTDYIQQYEGDSEVKAFWQGLADNIDRAINKAEIFAKKMDELPDTVINKLTEQGSNGDLTAEDVTALAGKYTELQTAMDESGVTAEDVAKHFNALSVSQSGAGGSAESYTKHLSALSDTMSEMKSAYDLLNTAQEEMASGTGLSAATIEKLAKENANYLDCLYEENGVIKLNTEAWKENANSKMLGDMSKIQQETFALNDKNKALWESVDALIAERNAHGDTDGSLTKQIRETIDEINRNSDAIEENQDLLRLYTAIYQQVSGDGTSAFASLTDALTAITDQYDLLNKAQKEFAESGALSASTLSSIVAKYPEMQRSVDLYIAGLKSEKELLADLSAAYGVDLKNYQNTVLEKMKNSAEFYNSLMDNQKKLIDELGEAYGIDLKNFQTIESKKLEFQAQIIKNLASNYSKYANASLEGLKAQQDAMLIGNVQGGYNSKEMKALSDAIHAIDNYNYAISHIATGAGLTSSWIPDKFSSPSLSSSSSSSSSSSATKEVEEYVAEIDDYREALERLERVQRKLEGLEYDLSNAGSLEEEIELQNKLLDAYQQEQDAIRTLNKLRSQTISEGVDKLRGMGFEIDYNREDNQFFVKNLEHLNALTAESKGGYETLQEATNALRKDTENLIGTLEDLNEQNQDGSKSLKDTANDIKEANIAIYESRVKASENAIKLNENWLDNAITSNDTDGTKKYTSNIIEQYRQMQQTVHEEAEYYRSRGYSDTSDEVSRLSDLWWQYEQNIKDAAISAYEAIRNASENQLGLTQTHLEQAINRGDLDSVSRHTDEVVSLYRQMQENVHQQADYYRSQGYAETSDEIRQLSALWWEYEGNIRDAISSAYDAITGSLDNKITLTENWLDNAINEKNSDNVKRYTTEMIANYKALQDVYHKQAEALRAAGYSDTSEEVSELSDAWWDLEENIKSAKENPVNYFIDIVDAAHDAVDEIQNVARTLSDAAQEFADNDGWISIDTYQSIAKLGAEYMQMLINENNELVINRDRINAIIEAKTRQLAVEQALSYVERLRLAATGASNENLDQLCFATTQATDSTWGLVYAELALMQQTGLLNGEQYQADLHNIQAIQSLAETAVAGIGQTAGAAAEQMNNLKKQLEDQKDALEDLLDELEDMKDGCDDLVKYVMDMLKDRIKQQIDALNDAKKAVKDYADQLKEAMRTEKENAEYEDELAKKLKAIAKLQSKIDAISLDDSRKAQAEKMALEEELAELQKDLADFQADHAMDVTEDTLDKQYEAYEQEKDDEIEKLEESISSTQKLYDMAIKYIKENWNTLYQELLGWNYEYGSDLNSEITAAWEAAQEAASRYGDFVTAIMGGIKSDIASITAQIQSLTAQISNLSPGTSSTGAGANGIGGATPNVVGKVDSDPSYSNDDMKQAKRKAVSDVVSQMRALSAQWHTADKATQKQLADEAFRLGSSLVSYGVEARRDEPTGVWYIDKDLLNPSNAGKPLYNCYHTGGFVGNAPLKPNERYIKAEDGELVLTSDQQDSFAAQVDRIVAMTEKFMDTPLSMAQSILPDFSHLGGSTINNVTNNSSSQPVTINQGDVIIQGAVMSPKQLAENINPYIEVTKDMANQLSHALRGGGLFSMRGGLDNSMWK